jgi:hypothetical protein
MKLNKYISLIIVGILFTAFISSCKAKDCRGRKKTAKTAMGGWL